MRPDLACTLFLACLELLKCVEVTAAERVKPSCLVQVDSEAPVPCGYFEHSDACCIEPLDTRHVQSTQRHVAGGVQGSGWQQHSNVTFTAPTEDALYLVSHDEGCGPAHECWEVSLRALGPLESLLVPAGAALQVLVSHLPGPKAYNVSLTTATVSRGGRGPGAASRPGSSTEDCRLLRGSTPVLDIVGDDATVRLVPPGVPQGDPEPDAQPGLPGVCVTLHSDQCPVDCRDFTVPPQCRRTRFHQTERCVEKPFDSALTFRNVTRLNVSRLDAGPANSSHVVPLLFHCARLQLGGCVVATATVAVPLHPPSVRAEVMVPDKWTTTGNAVVLAAALTLLCVLLLFAVRNFWTGPPPRSLLIFQVAGGGAADGDSVGNRALKSSLSRLSLRRASLKGAVSVAPSPAPAEARRLLLVYCRDGGGAEGSAARAFSGAVRVLARMLSASGRIEVTDMHEDPLLPEEGPVLRASTVLADESTCLVLVATPALAEALRPTTTVLDLDIFQKFVSALLLCLSHTPRCAPTRLFTVCLDARHLPNFLIGIPVAAVFVMPFHIADLVESIPGLAGEAIPSEKQFQADELKLRKYVNQYVNPGEPETPVIVRI